MTHWDRLGPHIDLAVRAWNIDHYRRLFGNDLGEEIFVFNQEQAQILVAAAKQTIPYMLPQPLAPPGRGGPAQPQGALAHLLHRGGREVGEDIGRAGQIHPPNDYLTFLRESIFDRNSVNAMRQRVLLSWMRNVDGQNVDDADPVNALNNLLHAEHDDGSTQVLGEQDANFEAPPQGERNHHDHYQAPHNGRAPPQGLAAPGGALRAAQEQFEPHGGKSLQYLCFLSALYFNRILTRSLGPPLYHRSIRASRFTSRP